MTVEKPKRKQLLRDLRPITKGADSVMNQPEFLSISCKWLKARESRAYKVRLLLVLLLIGWKTGASQ